VEWRVAGGTLHTRSMQADDVGVVAKGTPVWGRCFRPSEAIIISFNTHFLEMVARESFPGEIELKSRFHTSDLQIRALGILLDRETRAGCPTGRLYAESLGTALAAHVLRTYSVSPPRTVEYRGGLPRYELRHVMDYIVSNLAEDNSLQELADLVQMSPSHFCRSFKESTGRSPHQYILHLRVEEAKGLLRGTRLGIAEIAQRVGFSDQSHFTMIFRQVVGTTPAHWRGRELIGSFRRSRSTTKWQFSANNDTNSI